MRGTAFFDFYEFIFSYLQLLFYLRSSARPGEHGVWAREDSAHSSRQGGEVIPDYLSITDYLSLILI